MATQFLPIFPSRSVHQVHGLLRTALGGIRCPPRTEIAWRIGRHLPKSLRNIRGSRVSVNLPGIPAGPKSPPVVYRNLVTRNDERLRPPSW
eukprot:1355000-Amorphochlora_amoeboformis.AAC.2